jgi:UDP-sugar pyrophosphorylase
MLELLGAKIDPPRGAVSFNGIHGLQLWPRVVWSPLFALTFDDLQSKVQAAKVRLGADTSLVITSPDARITSLDISHGAVVVASKGVVVDRDTPIENEGWEWAALTADKGSSDALEEERIRGFKVVKHSADTF